MGLAGTGVLTGRRRRRGAPLLGGYVSLSALATPNPNPRRRRRRVPWNEKVPGAEESSTHSQSRASGYVIVLDEKKKNGTAGRTER